MFEFKMSYTEPGYHKPGEPPFSFPPAGVEPDKVDDAEADKMAYEIAKKIEEEMEYPGVLKVVVIREKRSVAYAK